MAWDNIWPLPRSSYTRSEVENAVGKAIKELGVKRLPDKPYIDWEGDGDDPGFAFNVSVPRKLLVKFGDQPDDADEYHCVFTVAQNTLADDSERWEVCVHSNDEANRTANMAVSNLAAEVSLLLGGPDSPEAL
jgi:hypothetical protein